MKKILLIRAFCDLEVSKKSFLTMTQIIGFYIHCLKISRQVTLDRCIAVSTNLIVFERFSLNEKNAIYKNRFQFFNYVTFLQFGRCFINFSISSHFKTK